MFRVTTPRRGLGPAENTIELRESANEILEDIQPASVRAVCYQLINRRLIPDMSKTSIDKRGRVFRIARKDVEILWACIDVGVREAECIPQRRDTSAFINIVSTSHRTDCWLQQPVRVEGWSEKGTIRGTRQPVIDMFGVVVRVVHGYSSVAVMHEVAQETEINPKRLTVLYIGEWDCSGMHMREFDSPSRDERYGGHFTLKRIASAEVNGRSETLPSIPAKKLDKRYRSFVNRYGTSARELDALKPNILGERVRHLTCSQSEPTA